MNGPRLPERARSDKHGSKANSNKVADQSCLQQLQANTLLQQFADQPDKLLSILQNDRVLAEAAAGNPSIAALLDPSTLQHALSIMQGNNCSAHQQQHGAAVVDPKALMMLQNYAMQLQQARAQGSLQWQQQQPGHSSWQPAVEGKSGATLGDSSVTPNVGTIDNHLVAMAQQRLMKLQQRSSMLQGPVMPCAGALQHQEQCGAGHLASLTPSQPATHQQEQHQHQAQHPHQRQHAAADIWQDQLQQQTAELLPDTQQQPAAPQSTQMSAASLHRLSHQSSSSSAVLPSSPRPHRLARLTAPEVLTGSTIMSPLARITSPCGSGPTGGSACMSPGASGQLQRRSSSSLSHRVLRLSTANPLDLKDLEKDLEGSGSHTLSIERLQSGNVILDITPPTRVTQELAWSVDPSAAFVLDAASSGSYGQTLASDSSAQLSLSTQAAGQTAASCEDVAAADHASTDHNEVPTTAAAAAAAACGLVEGASHSPTQAERNVHAPEQSMQALQPLGSQDSTVTQGTYAGIWHSVGAGGSSTVASKQDEDVQQPCRLRTVGAGGNCSRDDVSQHGGSSQGRWALQTDVPAAQQQNTWQQQRQQQQQQHSTRQAQKHFSYVDLSDNANSSSRTVSWAQDSATTASSHHTPALVSTTAAAGSRSQCCAEHTAAAARSATHGHVTGAVGMLSAQTYYESVPPSTWGPNDVDGAPGDYLELYRRAYCTYADALFPPLWLALMGALVALHLLPLWQVCVVGLVSFWGGLWLMVICWAGVPPAHLGISRVTPVMTVCLELVCTGAFVTQVLPVMWLGHSLTCVALLASSGAMLLLHLAAHLQNPGYTPLPDAEEGLYAGHVLRTGAACKPDRQASSSSSKATSATHSTADHSLLLGTANQQAAQQPHEQQQSNGGISPTWQDQPLENCWTCRVKRNLRSKHCPLCKRCVERFDHHCPVLGNCVGAGNHKTFVAFLACMLLSQLLFSYLVSSMLIQAYLFQDSTVYSSSQAPFIPWEGHVGPAGLQAAAGFAGITASSALAAAAVTTPVAAAGAAVLFTDATADSSSHAESDPSVVATTSTAGPNPVAASGAGGAAATLQSDHDGDASRQNSVLLVFKALWSAGSTHVGMLLLLVAQVPTMMTSSFLLVRALALAAANLTVNEWMNRHRYAYLHYTGAGFSNRFDKGFAANCYDFWCGPLMVDYWQAWDTAEQELKRKGMTVLVPQSAAVLIRFWDRHWSQIQHRLVASRERRRALKLQRRMAALGLHG